MSIHSATLKDCVGNTSKELWNLAVRHREILKHKFPKFRYFLSGSYVSEKIVLHVDIVVYDNDGADDDSCTVTAILIIIFSSDSLIITEPKKPSGGMIYYADPGFTDDFLSDKLEELVLKMRLNGEMAIDLGGT